MNMKLYNATQARLRSEALEMLAQIEAHLSGTTQIEDGVVDKITAAAGRLAQIEGALITLQQYFQPPVPAPMPAVPGAQRRDEEPLAITPEMSPTYKKSLEKQKLKEGSTKRRKKKDE